MIIHIFYWVKYRKSHVICNTSTGIKVLGLKPSQINSILNLVLTLIIITIVITYSQ